MVAQVVDTFNHMETTVLPVLDTTMVPKDYVDIHDTWDEQTHSIAYGNWWHARATWVIP